MLAVPMFRNCLLVVDWMVLLMVKLSAVASGPRTGVDAELGRACRYRWKTGSTTLRIWYGFVGDTLVCGMGAGCERANETKGRRCQRCILSGYGIRNYDRAAIA